eukprot:TRINITY_DN1916_c0_g2_i1.p1 TRINITY_DN1916_c0_g2~~TRINITY_DN1916_c0_g2_i1.p1  ORF type:complete len:804 (+),score=118.07 TRINITY_DN1916_c0_g2_i1:133-2544(+)
MDPGEGLLVATPDQHPDQNAGLAPPELCDSDVESCAPTPIERLEEECETLQKKLISDPTCERTKHRLANALLDLGTNLKAVGRGEEGVKKYHESLVYNPQYCAAYYNLGVTAAEACKPQEAFMYYEKALSINPLSVESLCNMGVIKRQIGDLEGACEYYSKALKVQPNFKLISNNYSVALSDLGTKLMNEGRIKEALSHYEESVLANPTYPDAYYNMGVLYAGGGDLRKSVYNYQLAVHMRPDYAEAWNNLGVVFKQMGSLDRAVECYERALALNGTFAQTMNNLSVILSASGNMDRAQKLLRKAIQMEPLYAEAYNNLGVILRDEGILEEALDCYSRCLSICPAAENAAQNRLLALNFSTKHTLDQVQREHIDWGERIYKAHPPTMIPFDNSKDISTPMRKIKVAYLSPDFYQHSVSYFIHAILENHNPEVIDVYCFSNVMKQDSKTFTFKKLIKEGNWIDIQGKPAPVVETIARVLKIDILIDLSGHTAHNRLDVFARRCAPVQISWIGYPNTTGLTTIDYRITDNNVDPRDRVKTSHYSETLYRLPDTFLCYRPDTKTADQVTHASTILQQQSEDYVLNFKGDIQPIVSQRTPCEQNEYITFGTFNNMAKIGPDVAKVWASILCKVPGSKLFCKSKPFAEKRVRDTFRKMFTDEGVDGERIVLLGIIPHHFNHLQAYENIDIALDCWPYAGTTTSCEALSMGVPMVTLQGESHAQNVGVSLLRSVSCPELIATTVDQYVEITTQLASDIPRLNEYRNNIPSLMKSSSLCDGKQFTSNLETAFVDIWQHYCNGTKAGGVQN